MGTIRDYYEKISFIHRSLPNEVERMVYDLSDRIIALNTEYQMFLGKDATGMSLPGYARDYNGQGKGYPKIFKNPYNLFIDGDLFKSVDFVYKGFQIHMFSDNPEHPFLKYNPLIAKNLIGLINEHQDKLNYEILLPKIRTWVTNSLK